MEAVRVALQVARPAVRAALYTTGGPDGLTVVLALLHEARPPQILAGASTAALIGPALPADLELVELGVPPLWSDRTYELRIARQRDEDEGPSDASASNLAWAHRAVPGPLLGREPSLATLTSIWQATLRGERRMALLRGEGGIGKTSVAAELALQVHADGALVLYGRWDPDQISPYQAMREALGTYVERVGPAGLLRLDLEGHQDQIRRLLPAVGSGLGGRSARAGADPEGERVALYDAVRAWLDALARQRPVLLVWDDLHWADRSSHLLLLHLRQATGNAPWTLLLTARPAGAERGEESDPGEDRGLHVVDLQGLDPAAVSGLVQRTLGHILEPDGEAIRWLTTATAGNPLLVQHILRGVGTPADATAVSRELLEARNQLPEPLTDVIRWRVGQLPAPTRRALADAAIIGSTVDIELVADVVSTPPVVLRTALEPALREHLLVADDAAGHYSFTHDVIRRALGDDVGLERSSLLHRRVASALESRAEHDPAIQPSEIAYHHLHGAGHESAADAVRWARRGAEAARQASAFDESVRLLLHAVEVHDSFHLTGRDPDAIACELRLELADAHDFAGHFAARDTRYLEAAVVARRLDRTDLLARAALGFGGRLPAAPLSNPTGCELLEETLERLPGTDSALRALVLARLAHLRYYDAPHARRRTMADAAVAMARRLDDPTTLARALLSRCFALDGPDDVDDCLSTGTEVIEIGERTDDPDLILQGMRLRISALLAIGRHREARQLATAFAELARQVSHQEHLRLAALWDIFWTAIEGRFRDVESMADRLATQLTNAGHPQGPLIRYAYTIVPRWLHGELEPLRPILEALRVTGPSDTVWWAMCAWLDAGTGQEKLALARLDERDPGEVVAGLERDIMWWPTMVACAIAASCGHERWAEEIHTGLLPFSGQLCLAGYAIFGGAVDHHLGTLALTLGRPDEAVERLGSALDRHRALGAVSFTGLTARWLAHALTTRGGPGDHDRAAALWDEAEALTDRYGLHGSPSFDQPAEPGG
jgi:hypothetical protein